MKRLILSALLALSAFSAIPAAMANEANDRLVIVNGNSGHVVYDDGHDDLYCVTRRHIVGYDDWGHPVRRRSMHCR